MKLTIEPTAEMIRVNGTATRIWKGTDEHGVEVKVWVRAIEPQTHDEAQLEQFESELERLPPLQVSGVDYRFIA